MLKRLIEVALPLKEISEQASGEKYIQRNNPATLHLWWARRPLTACRAVVFASLIPDPDDPECPEQFRTQVKQILSRNEFKPKNGNGSSVEDTPRNRCLEFIKYLVRWDNSNNPDYITPARQLIAAAHSILHPNDEGDAPIVLDPFAGGGAIPLEVLRLNCEAHALDLNPVAYLIELATLVYPQKYGQPDSRPIPDYIKRLVAHNRASRKKKGEGDLFDKDGPSMTGDDGEIIPDVEITEDEYRKNPLAADVKYWGHWVLANSLTQIAPLYAQDPDGAIPVSYLWARTVICPNPQCGKNLPLLRQLWLCKKTVRRVALQKVVTSDGETTFAIAHGKEITFDPTQGSVRNAKAACLQCGNVVDGAFLRNESRSGKMFHQLLCVVTAKKTIRGRMYRLPSENDDRRLALAHDILQLAKNEKLDGISLIPDEAISNTEPRRISPPLYGLDKWADIFNPIQLATLISFVRSIDSARLALSSSLDEEYAKAVTTYLALGLDRGADHWSALCTWNPNAEKVQHTYTRQALPFVWDYAEANVIGGSVGDWISSIIDNEVNGIVGASSIPMSSAHVHRGSATKIPLHDSHVSAVITDPPYYDSVPYSDLSDFFYVWLKRTVGKLYPQEFVTPLTPKSKEIVEQRPHSSLKKRKDSAFYEAEMSSAFTEAARVVRDDGIVAVMFAHKTTTAWETLIAGLLTSGLCVTASWPIDTESKTRMGAQGTASLASSVTLVCRKRTEDVGDGLWDDVRQELKTVAKERLDFFWDQGIRGADFFISAIGPALSVYGRYARVIRLSGEEVTVGEFLDEVRSLVTGYALTKILHSTNTANIDPESRFYVVWKWSYGDAKVPADESFKLAQALGIDTEEMGDKTGVLDKSGENVQCLPVEKRMKMKYLGEPDADGTPASLIDVLHRMCVFRDKGDSAGMAQFLGNSGQARNPALWLVAQAISETLPDGEREKQLM